MSPYKWEEERIKKEEDRYACGPDSFRFPCITCVFDYINKDWVGLFKSNIIILPTHFAIKYI